MTDSSFNPVRSATMTRAAGQTLVRTLLLVVAGSLLGLGAGALWYYHSPNPRGGAAPGNESTGLSDATKALLERLDSPVEIRFYSILDPAAASDSLKAFAGRVDELISAYQSETSGKIKVTRFNSPSLAGMAFADGLRPFNLDKGEGSYLGIAVVLGGQKESLPQLLPEWERALEPDLTRAIARVLSASAPANPGMAAAPASAATIEAVKRAIPDLASVSVQEGSRILRDAALSEFKAAASEMQTQVQEASLRLNQAQNGGSEADQQAAMKHLQEIQAQQTEKIKQLAARSQAEIDAFKQLKAAAR